MWAKDANPAGTSMTWADALAYANNLTLGTSCGGEYTDWRLPNKNELNSLVDAGNYNPVLPTGHPFTLHTWGYYWASTTGAFDTNTAWLLNLSNGWMITYSVKGGNFYVWPVRGGI